MPGIDPGLNFFGHLVSADMTLAELQQFLNVVDKYLRNTATRLKGKYNHFGDDRSSVFEEAFPQILYASVITAVVSFLERESREFADALREASSCAVGLRDLSGAWLERFRKYCEKVARLDLGLTDAEWEDIKGVVEVRNCLVHSGGWLPDFQGRATVEAFARRHQCNLSDRDDLHADLHLAQVVLESMRVFTERIYRVALDKYPRSE
jgi:hypothetical protein